MSEFVFTAGLTDFDMLAPSKPRQSGVLYFCYWFIAFRMSGPKPTFTVTQSSPAAAKPANVPITDADMVHSTQAPQFEVWFFRVAVAPGTTITVRTELPPKIPPSASSVFPRTDVFSFDPAPNTSKPVALSPRNENPPRLVLALNSTFVPDPTTLPRFTEHKAKKGADLDFETPGTAEVAYLVHQIYDRLSADFRAPWFGPDGGPQAQVSSNAQLPKDERWARLMAERFSIQPYTLPSIVYSSPSGLRFDDRHLYYKMQHDEDPAYPIVGECQHHVTAAALGRGFRFAEVQRETSGQNMRTALETMFTAGPSSTIVAKLLPSGEASWLTRAQDATTLSTLDDKFQPGSAFAFNDSDSSQAPEFHPHIAYVMRIIRNDKKEVQKIQFFDVGGMNIAEPKHPAIDTSLTYEYPWSSNGKQGASGAYAGTALLTASSASLDAGLDRLARARPLGLARLVLARRNNPRTRKPTSYKLDPIDDWLLYASPLLRMYESGGNNYHLSRYLWSLRELPGAEHIQAIWQISTPRSALADAMVYGLGTPVSRAVKLASMIKAVAAKRPQDHINTDGTKPLPLQALTLGICELSHRPDGSVYLIESVKSDADTKAFTFLARDNPGPNAGAKGQSQLPWGQATTKADTVKLDAMSDLPAYFRDDA